MNALNITDPANLDTPVFPVSVAAQAALVQVGTVRMWFTRDRIKLFQGDADYGPGIIAPERAGVPRLLSLRVVLTLAAGAVLARRGVEIEEAYQACFSWTHYGEGWNGQGPCPRDPAALFALPDFTVLIHHAGNGAKVVRYNTGAGLDFTELFGTGGPVRSSPALVLLNSVDKYARGICEGYLHE